MCQCDFRLGSGCVRMGHRNRNIVMLWFWLRNQILIQLWLRLKRFVSGYKLNTWVLCLVSSFAKSRRLYPISVTLYYILFIGSQVLVASAVAALSSSWSLLQSPSVSFRIPPTCSKIVHVGNHTHLSEVHKRWEDGVEAATNMHMLH